MDTVQDVICLDTIVEPRASNSLLLIIIDTAVEPICSSKQLLKPINVVSRASINSSTVLALIPYLVRSLPYDLLIT